jgi:hypothetical protein
MECVFERSYLLFVISITIHVISYVSLRLSEKKGPIASDTSEDYSCTDPRQFILLHARYAQMLGEFD